MLFRSRGVKQGDPLGPLYFALALQPILQQVIEGADRQLYGLAYLDDVTLFGNPQTVADRFLVLQTRAREIGLDVNMAKSVEWGPRLTQSHAVTTFTADGFKTLGGHLGTLAFQQSAAEEHLHSYDLIFKALKELREIGRAHV